MKRLSSSRSTGLPLSLPPCCLRPYGTTTAATSASKPELKWRVDVGSYSSSSSSTPPEPYYDEEVNIFWPVTSLDPPPHTLSFLTAPRPTTPKTHLFTDHGPSLRNPQDSSDPSSPLRPSRSARPSREGGKTEPWQEEVLAKRARAEAERRRTDWSRQTPEENDPSNQRAREAVSYDASSRSPPTFLDANLSESVLAARRSASLSSSPSSLSSFDPRISDASFSQPTSSSSTSQPIPTNRLHRPAGTLLRPTPTPTLMYSPPVEHVRPDRTAASRAVPPQVAPEPASAIPSSPDSTTPLPNLNESISTIIDPSSPTTATTSTSRRPNLPSSASGNNPFSSSPLLDSAPAIGPYLAPLASLLGQKEAPSACRKKARFLSWEADGEQLSAGQRTLATLKKAARYLDSTSSPLSQGLRQASSKAWIAPKRLVKENLALYFPDLAGHSLREDLSEPILHTTDVLKGRISLVSCSGSILNTEQTSTFTTPAWAAFKHDPDFSLVQLNIQSTALKSLLVPYFVTNIRAAVPKELHSTYIICPSAVHDSAEGQALGMKHALAGYVYLVDENLKIRWAGSGSATEEERRSLLVATQVLLHRFKTNVDNESLAQDRYPAHKLSEGILQWLENKPKSFQPLSLEAPSSERGEREMPLIA